MSDANFSELVQYAYTNVTESAEDFTDIVAEESISLGTIIFILFIVLMIFLIIGVIIFGIIKVTEGH